MTGVLLQRQRMMARMQSSGGLVGDGGAQLGGRRPYGVEFAGG